MLFLALFKLRLINPLIEIDTIQCLDVLKQENLVNLKT